MFDIGFTELLLCGLVALVVLGPERLPGAVRTAGLWIGRIKRSFNAIKADVEREIGADEIRRQLHNEQILDLEREMKSMKNDILAPGKSTAKPTAEASPTTVAASLAPAPFGESTSSATESLPTTPAPDEAFAVTTAPTESTAEEPSAVKTSTADSPDKAQQP